MLLQILEKGGMNKYPIRPVVVFAHDDATILRANKAHLAPQTDIIRKSMLENWLQENSSSEINYRFSQMILMQLRILLFNIHKNMLQKKCKWLFRIWMVGLVGVLAACDAKDASVWIRRFI